jgi:cytochrome c oxidase assembly protein subunit 15
VVAFHLLVSLAMICLAVVLLHRLREGDGAAVPLVPDAVGWLARGIFLTGWAVLYVGTVVTGSGPHAGDAEAQRNGLDPRSVTQLHTDLVFLLLGLTIAAVLVLRVTGAPPAARRAAVVLLVVELLQGVVGFVQYFTGLPVPLVTLHLAGAALIAAAMTWLLVALQQRSGAGRTPRRERQPASAR